MLKMAMADLLTLDALTNDKDPKPKRVSALPLAAQIESRVERTLASASPPA